MTDQQGVQRDPIDYPPPPIEPAIPTRPEALVFPHDPPRGEEPPELDEMNQAAHGHARGPTGPDLSNVGNVVDDRPHFIRLEDGQDPADAVCGQDGKPWPCPDYLSLHPESPAEFQGPAVVSLEAAARAAGLSQEEFTRRLAASRENAPGPS